MLLLLSVSASAADVAADVSASAASAVTAAADVTAVAAAVALRSHPQLIRHRCFACHILALQP